MAGNATGDEQVGQCGQHYPIAAQLTSIGRPSTHGCIRRSPSGCGTCARHGSGPRRSRRPALASLRPQPDAGPVRKPQMPAARLFVRNLQPLPPPDRLDPLVIDAPAGLPQQGRDPAVAIAAIAPGQLDDVGGQRHLVIDSCLGSLALGRAVLPEHRAGPALRDRILGTGHARWRHGDRRGLEGFPWPPPPGPACPA